MSAWIVEQSECLDALRRIPDACVSALVTDPPAGIAFMGKSWDAPKNYGFAGDRIGAPPGVNLGRNPTCQTCGGRKRAGAKTKACRCGVPQWNELDLRLRDREMFISFLTDVMREALRVMKPGAHGLVWALPRTSHWTATALENAGFEVRDVVTHLFGSGFPKSHNVAKELDRVLGAEPTVVGSRKLGGNAAISTKDKGGTYGVGVGTAPAIDVPITVATSPEAQAWEGWGTALKPASEHWILVRKPLVGTIAKNVVKHGTGGINVDACRIATDWNEPDRPESWKKSGHSAQPAAEKIAAPPGQGIQLHEAGRWPANVTFDEEAAEMLPEGTARFFYVAKPSTKERELGCAHLPKKSAAEMVEREDDSAGINNPRAGAGRTSSGRSNHHPTVKSIALMRWLVRLVTPPGGVILDPFAGSGTTGCAAVIEGFDFAGIEQDPDYVAIARARIDAALRGAK